MRGTSGTLTSTLRFFMDIVVRQYGQEYPIHLAVMGDRMFLRTGQADRKLLVLPFFVSEVTLFENFKSVVSLPQMTLPAFKASLQANHGHVCFGRRAPGRCDICAVFRELTHSSCVDLLPRLNNVLFHHLQGADLLHLWTSTAYVPCHIRNALSRESETVRLSMIDSPPFQIPKFKAGTSAASLCPSFYEVHTVVFVLEYGTASRTYVYVTGEDDEKTPSYLLQQLQHLLNTTLPFSHEIYNLHMYIDSGIGKNRKEALISYLFARLAQGHHEVVNICWGPTAHFQFKPDVICSELQAFLDSPISLHSMYDVTKKVESLKTVDACFYYPRISVYNWDFIASNCPIPLPARLFAFRLTLLRPTSSDIVRMNFDPCPTPYNALQQERISVSRFQNISLPPQLSHAIRQLSKGRQQDMMESLQDVLALETDGPFSDEDLCWWNSIASP